MMTKLTDFEKGWICSAIDGEGCITYNLKNNSGGIRIANTNYDFIKYAYSVMKCSAKIRIDKRQMGNRKILYEAILNGKKQLVWIIPQIVNRLIIKKDKAKILLTCAKKRGEYKQDCKLCNEKHYSRGYCIKHWYINYGKEYHKKWRASKKR